jgi:DNA mismatch endonuclease (patch repair protein)
MDTDKGFASTLAVRRKMQRQRRHDTPIELALRSELFRRGLRYNVHRRPLPGLRREADIVFPRVRLAVFVDSCWWHGCPAHRTLPHANREWWETKLRSNQARDLDTNERLEAAGWTVIRVWEHEDMSAAAALISQVVAKTRARRPTTICVDRPTLPQASGRGSAELR